MNFVTKVNNDTHHINEAVAKLNDALELLDLNEWHDAVVKDLYADIDRVNTAIAAVNQYGISNEALKIMDCTDSIIDALNQDNPTSALEGQEDDIWQKIKNFFKELWRRIAAAFRALVGKVDNKKAAEVQTVIKEVPVDKVNEVLNTGWTEKCHRVYSLTDLADLKQDVSNCISFVKTCNELDLKTVVSKDPAVYNEFEQKFVKDANAIFGATVDVHTDVNEASASSWLPFVGKKISQESKTFSVKFNFANERGSFAVPDDPKTKFGYKSGNDLTMLCRYQEEFISAFDTITQIIERINQNIDKHMEVFEDPLRKLIPPVSLHKVRALLDKIPRACTECNKQVYTVVSNTSRMVSIIMKQLTGSDVTV